MSIWKNLFGVAIPEPTEKVSAKRPPRRVAVAKPSARKVEPIKAPPLRKARKPKLPEHSTGKTYKHNIAAATAARMTKRSGGKELYKPTQLGRSDLWTIVGPIKQYTKVTKRKAEPATKKALQAKEDKLFDQAIAGAALSNAAVDVALTSLNELAEYAKITGDSILAGMIKDAFSAVNTALSGPKPIKGVIVKKPEAVPLP